MSAAGFGLKLHDLRHGTQHHEAFDTWWDYARGAYVGLDGDTAPTTYTFYYDPLLDLHHRLPVRTGLTTAFYLAPQVPADARRLFDAASADAGLQRPDLGVSDRRPRLHPRVVGFALFLAREWGDSELAARLADFAEQSYEPRWDRATGEFTWGFGLGEEHPRGQYNAGLVLAEPASEGAWQQFGQQRLPESPLVSGVDFPTVGLSEARWADGILHLQLSAATPAVLGSRTSFEVVGLAEPATWQASGPDDTVLSVTPAGALRVETTVGPAPIAISRPG
jgi:hypothetical protein